MKKFTIILLTLFSVLPMFAQNAGKYGHGQDSIDCIKYLSYYKEYMKQGNMQDALPSWRSAISICPPQANQNMLIDGQKLMRFAIPKEKDAKVRASMIDTLLNLHDTRAEVYPKYRVAALNAKAIDIINYKVNEDDPAKLYADLDAIISETKESTQAIVFVKYMEVASALYKDGKIEAEEMMGDYTKVSEMIDAALTAKADGQMAGAKQDVETLFADSGVASCDNLVALFTPRYDANPNDKETLATIVKLLSSSDCADTELYLKAVESLHAIEPSASTAYYLYKLYSANDKNEEAAATLEQAISMCEDQNQAADYCFELGSFYFKKMSKYAEAVNYAKKAIELNEANAGKCYLLIGTIWGSVRCGGHEIARRASYWVATDYMMKAKNADESLAEDASRLAGQYHAYFPEQAEAFMYDVVDGQSYTVSCNGMRETTTVRTRK